MTKRKIGKKEAHLYKGGVPKRIFSHIEKAAAQSTDFKEIAGIAASTCSGIGSYDMKIYLAELERNGYITRTAKGVYEWN